MTTKNNILSLLLLFAASLTLILATPTPTMLPTLSNTAYPYDPSYAVKDSHAILHVNPYTLKPVSHVFAANGFSKYFMSLLTVPIILSSLSLLALILLLIFSNCGPGNFPSI